MDGMFVNLLFVQGGRKVSYCSYKDDANLCESVEWFPSFCLADVVFGRKSGAMWSDVFTVLPCCLLYCGSGCTKFNDDYSPAHEYFNPQII